MIENTSLPQKELDYPREVIFKAIFRNNDDTLKSIESILKENEIDGDVTSKASGKSNFISYTVRGNFPSEERLNSVCGEIVVLEGFMSLF